jgi:transcriptional regulator with XRE-family HTH domain
MPGSITKKASMRLKNRFGELLAVHERRTGKKWTYEDISNATGVSPSTLSAYAQNKVRRFDAVTVEALIHFFGCGIEDFFVLEEDELGEAAALATA